MFTHISQHIRPLRGQDPGTSVWGACHDPAGYAEVFHVGLTYEGWGPEGLADACDVDWTFDAIDTSASDDHQSGDETPVEDDEDMDVDNDDDDDDDDDDDSSSSSSGDDDDGNVWSLRNLVIRDQPVLRKYMHTHIS